MGIENIFENISLKQMSSNIKTIQDMLNDFTDSRVTYADVTTKTLPEVFKDMGYEVGQLPDGSWGMVKSSTNVAYIQDRYFCIYDC